MTTETERKALAILERLRTEAQLAKNGGHPILARSFELAIAEIERLSAAYIGDQRRVPSEDAAAVAVMTTDGCGLTIEGERVLCDDPRAKPDERVTPCMCRENAKAVLALLSSPPPPSDTGYDREATHNAFMSGVDRDVEALGRAAERFAPPSDTGEGK